MVFVKNGLNTTFWVAWLFWNTSTNFSCSDRRVNIEFLTLVTHANTKFDYLTYVIYKLGPIDKSP